MIYPFKLVKFFNNRSRADNRESFKIKRRSLYAYCCGIVGYLGEENTNEILLHGVEAMKNRGYDSCGICTLEDGKLKVTKCCSVGTPADSYNILKNKVLTTHKPSSLGIGHTRWATMGKPSDKNSHPHVDMSKTLALVHNGTITNIEELYKDYYRELVENKLKKEKESEKFQLPDSDTEAVAIFVGLEYEKEGNLFEAFKNTIKKLKGTWALCMMSSNYPKSLFLAAHEAPLLFARSKEGIYVGSEPTVFVKYVKDCVALKDGEVFELTRDNIESYYSSSKLLKLQQNYIEETHEPYPNWFLKEVSDQIYVGRIIISLLNLQQYNRVRELENGVKEEEWDNLERLKAKFMGNHTLPNLGGDPHFENYLLTKIDIGSIGFILKNLSEEVQTKLKNTKRLLFVGCGTSLYAGTYVAKILQKTKHFETVEVDDASDLTIYRYNDKENTIVHISNSGETLDCILASNYIKKINPNSLNISMINSQHSTLERSTESTIHLRIGLEKSVPSTKAFSAQITMLLILGLYIIDRSSNQIQQCDEDSTDYSSTQEKDGSNELSDTSNEEKMELTQDDNYMEHYGSGENYRISSLYKSLSKFPSAIGVMLKDNPLYDDVARRLKGEKIVYILGRGCGHVAALEISLKMKEVAYIQAEGVLSGAMKHGFYAMIVEKEHTPTISIITSEDREMTINPTRQLKARGSFIIVVTDLKEELEFADIVIKIPNIGALTAALSVIPMQIITSKIASLSGRNPDIPRGLAKTVTTL